jgi:hypothetical protein
MTNLHDILERRVSNGAMPGAVGLIARGDRVEVQVDGSADADGNSLMARDSIFPYRFDHHTHHPAQPVRDGRPDPARFDGGLLAVRGRCLRPGAGRGSAAPSPLLTVATDLTRPATLRT